MGMVLKERKHSKFSASGSERWLACPGSVNLSEGLPDKSSPWAEEGTRAHEVLEHLLISTGLMGTELHHFEFEDGTKPSLEMWMHCRNARDFIIKKYKEHPGSDLLIETRIHLGFIHPEMFGTFDSAIIDHFGILHVFDFKYGAGHAVSPRENLQMIFYAIGVAHLHHWNFKRVRMWIIQPRIRGYDGPAFWETSISELKCYVEIFRNGVDTVNLAPNHYEEGAWCHWCKAKAICPLKIDKKLEEAKSVFTMPYSLD